ncbi:MAG: hypothetical protein ACRC20_12335 [Segniliparus sp.]|uniref:hypothetical protein n=1 Tax=Segniliparus sp. TaxID=2804064 RepID=UPI003F3C9AEC
MAVFKIELTEEEHAKLRAAVESSEHSSAESFLSGAVTRAVEDRLAAAEATSRIVDRSRLAVYGLLLNAGDSAVEEGL